MGYLKQFVLWLLGIVAKMLFALLDVPIRIKFMMNKNKRATSENIELADKHVLLIALFQTGAMRLDIQNLIEKAIKSDFVVLVSNNSRLENSPDVDFYEERPNYGRDFGAYKSLTKTLLKQMGLAQSKSITFLNDSVFYIPERITNLFSQVQKVGPREAFGITDNNHDTYHLASYFLTVGNQAIADQRFWRFWNSYRLTNSRPKIIKKGEMQLSKVLSVIVGKRNVRSIYNYESLVRQSQQLGEQHLLLKDKEYLIEKLSYLNENLNTGTAPDLQLKHNHVLRLLSGGAPAHGSIKAFLESGMPIIKLDIHYRGIAGYLDIAEIEQHIEDPEFRKSFRLEVLSRGIGYRDLTGLQKLFYSYGLK